jgi:phosphoesterase RecJ-like protein
MPTKNEDRMSPLEEAIKGIMPRLAGVRSAVLTTHVNPDGDGIGSEVAMAEWLSAGGCKTHILNHSETPGVYMFMDDAGRRIRTYDPERDAATIASADLILVLDTNDLGRLRSMEPAVHASRAFKICIDHHLDPHGFADCSIIDPEATSTGEIVYRIILMDPGRGLSPSMASALYCAIMTDTGSFRYPRVDPEIHRMAARLIEAGADPVRIYAEVYERWSTGRIHLLGRMLAGMGMGGKGRLAYASITQEMLQQTGTSEADTDNFTTYPMSIQGVTAGIIFLELKDGVKISFRSKGVIPINELAKEFGGNGHLNAAGARLYKVSLHDVTRDVLEAAEKYVAAPENT